MSQAHLGDPFNVESALASSDNISHATSKLEGGLRLHNAERICYALFRDDLGGARRFELGRSLNPLHSLTVEFGPNLLRRITKMDRFHT